MPKLVVELAQGNSFSETSENGMGAFSATRSWKVILNTASEALDINAATGVSIGTPYSDANPIPCVSIEGRADGESRLVRIITATYRATPGTDTATDPKTQEPTVRPAMYSMSTSLQEIAAWGGRPVVGGVSGAWYPAVNPVGDLVDGVTRLEPVVNISIDQYSLTDQTNMANFVGFVNSDTITFSSLAIAPHCCMLQGVSSQAVVEQFGEAVFRGFKINFAFAVRAHYTITRDGPAAIGWDMAIPQTGFNVINKLSGEYPIEEGSLQLSHTAEGVVASPTALASGTENRKVRANVIIAAADDKWTQRPSAQPVALNDDGTPRSRSATPPVLINRVCLQPEMAFGVNFSAFGIRWIG